MIKPLATAAAFGLAVAATAQTPPAAPAAAPPPAVAPVARPAKAAKPAAPANPNVVEAKTASGKTVHYDCTKAGNAHKTACKK